MEFSKLAIQLNGLYEEWEVKEYGRKWSTQEFTLDFVGDVDLESALKQTNEKLIEYVSANLDT